MSPVEIEVALHYFYQPDDHPAGSKAYQDAVQHLIDAGLLTGNPDHAPASPAFLRTEGLIVYVEALKAVPLPTLKQMWVMPSSGK